MGRSHMKGNEYATEYSYVPWLQGRLHLEDVTILFTQRIQAYNNPFRPLNQFTLLIQKKVAKILVRLPHERLKKGGNPRGL